MSDTKAVANREDVFLACQSRPTDSEEAFLNHMQTNNPPPDPVLFTYQYKTSLHPLTKTNFLKRLTVTTKAAGVQLLQGHGICISGTI
ncbi:hypothetical protein BDR04DRAFT_1162846 [Suillus decipiens]|nr:hypothetical protein BDR04DRAFT_1162846 [Suillus decipiens]